jgi:spermidine dehydrogenase
MYGQIQAPLHPDKPTLLTFYVSFHQPGLPIEEQGESGRKKLLGTSYAEFESAIRAQMNQLFSDAGFRVEKDIDGIILNRWTYAYVNPQPGFYFGKDGKPAPRDIIRKPFDILPSPMPSLTDISTGWLLWMKAGEQQDK